MPSTGVREVASPLSAATSTPHRVSARVARSRSSSAVGSVWSWCCLLCHAPLAAPRSPADRTGPAPASPRPVSPGRRPLVRHPPADVGRPQPVLGRERAAVPAHQAVDVGAQLVHRERVGVRRQHDVEVQPAVPDVTEVGKHRTGHVDAVRRRRTRSARPPAWPAAATRPGPAPARPAPAPRSPRAAAPRPATAAGPRRRPPGPRGRRARPAGCVSAFSPSVSTRRTSSGDCPGNGSATRRGAARSAAARRPRPARTRPVPCRARAPAGSQSSGSGPTGRTSAVARSTGRCASSSVAAVTTPSRPDEPTARSVSRGASFFFRSGRRSPSTVASSSASTTCTPSSRCRTSPCRSTRQPPALVATSPPTLGSDDRSIGSSSPCGAAAACTCDSSTPAAAVTARSSTCRSSGAVSRAVDSTPATASGPGTEAPTSPVFAPCGTSGTRCRTAHRTTVRSCSRSPGSATNAARPAGPRHGRS